MKIIGLYGKLEYLTESKLEEDVACHDYGATLFVDGYHIRSINEERLNRVKEYGGFPECSFASFPKTRNQLSSVPLFNLIILVDESDLKFDIVYYFISLNSYILSRLSRI